MSAPTTTQDVVPPTASAGQRTVGTVGLFIAAMLVIGNALHPFDGSTELYADISALTAKSTGGLWVIDHLVLAVVLMAVPWIAHVWRASLDGAQARLWGGAATVALLIGTVIGTIHLAGVDGAAMGSYGALLQDPGTDEMVVAAGEVLLRVHLATFLSWVLSFYVVAQLLLAVAALLDGRRRWLGALLVLGALLATASVILTALKGQLTTLSEPVLFRPATVTITVWLVVASRDLQRR